MRYELKSGWDMSWALLGFMSVLGELGKEGPAKPGHSFLIEIVGWGVRICLVCWAR